MEPVVRNLFEIRCQSYFDVSLGVLQSICEALYKYGIFSYFDSWFSDSVFPTYPAWKSIVKTKIGESKENTWKSFVLARPCYKLAETCLDLVSPVSISYQYPDLVTRLHVQITNYKFTNLKFFKHGGASNQKRSAFQAAV